MSEWRDLGLTYEEAHRGVGAAIRFELQRVGFGDMHQIVDMLRHLRAGLDMRVADQSALVGLLIAKGLVTQDEYEEQLRLAANEELARYEAHFREAYGLPEDTKFR